MVQYCHKNRHIDQWNRIESPEINPCIYGQLTCNKGPKIHNGEWTVSSISDLGKTEPSHQKKRKEKKLDYYLTPHIRIN